MIVIGILVYNKLIFKSCLDVEPENEKNDFNELV